MQRIRLQLFQESRKEPLCLAQLTTHESLGDRIKTGHKVWKMSSHNILIQLLMHQPNRQLKIGDQLIELTAMHMCLHRAILSTIIVKCLNHSIHNPTLTPCRVRSSRASPMSTMRKHISSLLDSSSRDCRTHQRPQVQRAHSDRIRIQGNHCIMPIHVPE